MANHEATEAADTIHLRKRKKKKDKKKEITAFRRSVLNYIYLTFIVPFQFKFVFYE